jgi:hypothetical protein
MTFRPEDQALLDRLEDEVVLERLFEHVTGARAGMPHARASGMIACVRSLPGGEAALAATRGGDSTALVRFLGTAPFSARPPALLHHAALFHASVARALEGHAPDAAASAWMRSIAAWIALGDEHTYLARLSRAVLGPEVQRSDATIAPEHVVLELLAELEQRATEAARTLAPAGRAAVLALAWVDEAARLAGATEPSARRVHVAAERRLGAVLEAALAGASEAYDDAKARDVLVTDGAAALRRAIEVWTWSGEEEAVEHFCVERLVPIGWELYRARDWDALRRTLEPFRVVVDRLASRIEGDPERIAYAAACAELLVFFADVERVGARKLELGERALRVCPGHRNGRLTVATVLAETAASAMRGRLFVRAKHDELARLESLVSRAETLYPEAKGVKDARAMLERVKSGTVG